MPTPAEWVRDALRRSALTTVPLTHGIALRSEALEGFESADPADRLLVATALEHELVLVTADDEWRGAGSSQDESPEQPRPGPGALGQALRGERGDHRHERESEREQLDAQGRCTLARNEADDRDEHDRQQEQHGLERALGQSGELEDALDVDRDRDEDEARERRGCARRGDEEFAPLRRVIGRHRSTTYATGTPPCRRSHLQDFDRVR